MITRNFAIQLLNKYKGSLTVLQEKISHTQNPLDKQMMSEILTALEAIKDGKNTISDGDTRDPQIVLETCLVNLNGRNFFQNRRYEHYLIDAIEKDDIDKDNKQFYACILNLKQFHASILQEKEKIIIYKAKNNKLGLTFPDVVWRDAFIKELGGRKAFSVDHRFANQLCPHIYPDKNPTTLYIHSYQSIYNHIPVPFPNSEMYASFLYLLRHYDFTNLHLNECINTIYFADQKLFTPGYNIKVPAPLELAQRVYDRAETQIEYAAAFINKEIRELGYSSKFFTLPSEIRAKIAAKATDMTSLPKDEREAIASNYLKRLGK